VDGADPARPASRWAAFRMPIWGLLARALLPPYAVDTRRVGDLALPLGCGLGLSVPGPAVQPLRSVTAAALCNFAPSCVETLRWRGLCHSCGARARCLCVSCWPTAWSGPTLCGENVVHIERVLLRSRAVEVSGTPPAAGVSWWIHGMSWDPLHRLRKRATPQLELPIQLAG
jgi:hypothetical protein